MAIIKCVKFSSYKDIAVLPIIIIIIIDINLLSVYIPCVCLCASCDWQPHTSAAEKQVATPSPHTYTQTHIREDNQIIN
jgi:hypothetical protein